jgi:hypothetical protein
MDKKYPPNKVGRGEVRLIPLSEMFLDFPSPEADERRQTIKRRIVEMAHRGYADATEEEVRRPEIPGPLPIDSYDESPPLSFTPANFRHGILLSRDIGWREVAQADSLTRIYDVPTTALVLLREHDYVTGRTLQTMARESVNSTVCDWPASLQVWFAPSGNCRCFLDWWTSKMHYHLQTWTSDREPDSAARLIADYGLEMAT